MTIGNIESTDVPPVLNHAAEDDTDLYVLGIRESAEEAESWSLLFMECTDAEDEQEIELGMDTYCLVVDPGQATTYGGVLECQVTGNRLHLLITDEAAEELGVPARLEFTLRLDEAHLTMVRSGLRRVLASGRPDAVPSLLEL